MRITLSLLTLLATVAAAHAAPPAVPATPAAVNDLILVQPFVLQQGYQHAWSAEKVQVRSGYLVVLKVNPDLVYPRQTPEPILYAGRQTVERINVGYPSGVVVGIVPGDNDLSRVTFWFGTPGLPEEVTASTIQAERRLAENAGLKPFAAEKVQTATRAGGEPLRLADQDALYRHAAKLIEKYSPEEKDLAQGKQAPRVGQDPPRVDK